MSHEAAFFEELLAAARRNISDLGVQVGAEHKEQWDGGSLDDYTSFIQISGAIQGGVILTVQASLALVLAEKYMIDPITPEEARTYAVEVVAELSNVICGNALTDRIVRPIYLGNPLMFVAKQAEIRTKSPQPFIRYFDTSSGSFQIMFIPMEKEAELATILNANY